MIPKKILPEDSCVLDWCKSQSITEAPMAYTLVAGLSMIGALLKRNAYIDHERFKIWPNISLLLIGPSGIGKDLTIKFTQEIIETIGGLDIIAGRTIEYFKKQLGKVGDPAACYAPYPELTAFLGGKDYQASLVQELTDILSTNDTLDVSTKGEGTIIIPRPTVTMHTGSTAAWLYKATPDGALEGGFFPRFAIVCAKYAHQHIAWAKYDSTKHELMRANEAKAAFIDGVKRGLAKFKTPRAMVPTSDARDFYRNWYWNRFKWFSPEVQAYANRSRDLVHKFALTCAVSRQHTYLEEVDYRAAVDIMAEIAKGIEETIKPMLRVARR